jgi:cytochrome c553
MKKILWCAVVAALSFLSARAADTPENWQKHCAKCHGNDGRGDTKMGKKAGVRDMTEAAFQSKLTDENAFKAVREGLREKGQEKMKPNKDLTDDEIKSLVAHVRKFAK